MSVIFVISIASCICLFCFRKATRRKNVITRLVCYDQIYRCTLVLERNELKQPWMSIVKAIRHNFQLLDKALKRPVLRPVIKVRPRTGQVTFELPQVGKLLAEGYWIGWGVAPPSTKEPELNIPFVSGHPGHPRALAHHISPYAALAFNCLRASEKRLIGKCVTACTCTGVEGARY